MTGLDSIAMAVAHLESNDDGEQKEEALQSDDGPTPNSASFVEGQPRLVSVGATDPQPDSQNSQEDARTDDKGDAQPEAAANTSASKQEGEDDTTHQQTCHDPTTLASPPSKTETKAEQPTTSFTLPSADMHLQQFQRPIALDLTTPSDASQSMMMQHGMNGMDYSQMGQQLPVNMAATNFSQHPARLPNQISQKILLKHQSDDGASDDPIASLLSRISHITSDLPLLFRLMEALCDLGVREHGPPAEVVANTVPIEKVGRCDVLSGRGGETNHHYGNVQYRRIVKACQPAYLVAKRRDKPRVAASIVRVIRSRSGRFLKKDSKDNLWRDVGNNKAREKSSQALREGAPELRNLVQLPDKQQTPPPNGPKLTPSHVVYMNESTGQPVVRNVDGNLLSAMALVGSSPSTPFGAYAGSLLPVGNQGSLPTGAAKSPGDIRAQLSGPSQAIYQQAIQQFDQILGSKRPAASPASTEEANKKPRTTENESKEQETAATIEEQPKQKTENDPASLEMQSV